MSFHQSDGYLCTWHPLSCCCQQVLALATAAALVGHVKMAPVLPDLSTGSSVRVRKGDALCCNRADVAILNENLRGRVRQVPV
jgi:hypothetical protein